MENLLLKKVEKHCIMLFILLLTNFGFAQIMQRGTSTGTQFNTATLTINKPAGVVPGDVMILNIVHNGNAGSVNSTSATGSGWTLINSNLINQVTNRTWRGTVLYRVADGSEGANFTFNLNATTYMSIGVITAFYNVDVTGGFDANGNLGGPFDVAPNGINVSASASNTTRATSLTTNTDNAAIVMLTQIADNRTQSNWRATSPSVLSALYDWSTTFGDDAAIGAAWAIKDTAGPTGEGNSTIAASIKNGAILLALKLCVDNTITLTSAVNTTNQTSCMATAITNITYNTTGATGATFTGLPAGVTGTWSSNEVTISGTPTESGTFPYTITLTGGCGLIVSTTGTLAVTPNNTFLLTSASDTLDQTICLNTSITNISFDTTGASDATFSGLPAGVVGSWAADQILISGIATESGSFPYTITLTGGCDLLTATGFLTINNNTAGAASSSPILCIDEIMTPITHSTIGATGIGAANDLPAGLTADWNLDTITISGTPTVSGTFNYSVPLTGGCGSANADGVIVVNTNNTITLTSAAGTDFSEVCINTPITDVTFSTVTATGATFTGLPAGITGNWLADEVTITGTPTESGSFPYTITLTGGCSLITSTGLITVNNNTVSVASSSPTLCMNDVLAPITHNTTGATGIGTANDLPAGVTADWNLDTITISGTPTVSGTFNYSIPLTGGCGSENAEGVIIVSANNAITLTSAAGTDFPTVCINTPIANVIFSTITATGATFTGLPAGITGNWLADVVTISGTPTESGSFPYTITLTGGCGTAISYSGTITVYADETPVLTSGAASVDQTICINTAINNITYNTTAATGATFAGLPAGVTGSWASNVVTISGVASEVGLFNYSVTFDGACGSITGTITVNINTVGLASASPNICIATLMPTITHATSGATGIGSAINLPAGVNAIWSSDMISINGTPTVAGVFNYSIPLTGGCGSVFAEGTITIIPNNTISLTSGTGTNSQSGCPNISISAITYNTTSATGATFSGLPAGVTGSWSADQVTISGAPTTLGTFPYTVTLTGGCGIGITASGTITVTPSNTITLTSAAGTNIQIRCINTAITTIRYSTTRATGATISGLPTGVTGSWAANEVTITGTPTVSGTFNYTVTLTGGCGTTTATGTLTVNINTVGVASSSPNVCINTAIPTITHTTTGATGRGTATGLPAGVTSSWASNTITISGTPTAAGTFNYSIPLTGGCGTVYATGTIIVRANNSITLSSGAGTNNQTRCIDIAMSAITFNTVSATGATFTGLPTGVSGSWSGNVVTIAGTPSVAGTFPYTVTLTGGCGSTVVTTSGTITVTANNTITLSSAAGTNNQTRCINTAISNITYTTVRATGATFSGLPAGVTGSWASNVVTISGTPSVSGNFTYTVTLTGGCGVITTTGTITVNPNNTIALASAAGTNNQTVCNTTAIAPISYNTTTATGATFSGFPAGVTGSWSSNVVTISGTPTATGTFNYTVTLTGGCGPVVTATGSIIVNPVPTITGTTSGSRTGPGSVNLGATASAGTISWFTTATGGTAIATGTTFATPIISTTTVYYVQVSNAGCTSSPRTAVTATINYPGIEIQGNAVTITNGDMTPSLGDWTNFGTTSITRTFTIRNNGGSALTIGALTIAGVDASDFTVATAPNNVVGVGGTTTFTITFNPTTIGTKSATISLVNNDGSNNPYVFAIQGTGVEQEIDIQGNNISIVDGDTTPTTADWTDFSSVAGTRTFTIRNTGNLVLNIGAITITGLNPTDFTVTTLPSATVAAFSTTTFTVSFSATFINVRSAIINVANNDANENPYRFTIQGFGIVPEIDIQGNGVSIVDGDTTPALADWTDFGSAASVRTFTIFNQGNFQLNIGAITFTGTNAAEFTILTAPSATVAAFSSTTFDVKFTPLAVGTRTARINIINNDSNENPYDFSLQGTGVAQEIDILGLGLSIIDGATIASVSNGTDFGVADIALGTISRTFTIFNTGSLPLTIANPTITGLNASEFTVTTNPATLTIGAGLSTSFVVTFNPTGVFTRVARVNIVNNDSNENPYDFSIQGTGTLDNDGDGIENNIDLDDDNDGIIDTIECGTCAGTPFVNGSFETPVIPASSYSIRPSSTVPGWTNSAEPVIEIWSNGFLGVPAAAGNQFAELNANIAGTLYQSFCLNGAGGTIYWSVKHRGRSGVDRADVRFGPTLALAQASTPIAQMIDGNTAWGTYSGIYTIPVGQTNIVLAFAAVYTATGSLSVGNLIDDVQIIINQNCKDSDGDGVDDIVDVDDDNDGIPSIEEAGFKTYSNNKSVMDRSSTTTWVDANQNGLNDYIEALISGGTYNIPDTDGDGVPNYLDLDSDNDTAFDVDESGLLNGDGDINGDGKGDGPDSDGDGLLDLYDNSTVYGSAFRAYAQDSDLNGIPDYLQLDANDDGVNDIQAGLYGSLDANNDGKIDGTGDIDQDGITDTFDTNTAVKGSPRDLNRKLYLDFDGRNDYAENVALLGGLQNATIMAWIDLNPNFTTTGVVAGQNKFHIRITAARKLEVEYNSTVLTYNTLTLNRAQWYHVAATYSGADNSIVKLYVNGDLVASQPVFVPIQADVTKLTLGKNPAANNSYFKGKIDEVRVFNVALSDQQVQRMVYQEIGNNGGQVRGVIIPKDIENLLYTNLIRYYRMDTYKDDIVDDLTTPAIDLVTGMKMYNHKVINYQQAPMPFVTLRPGTFATAIMDTTKDINGNDVLLYDNAVIDTKHNIVETANINTIGLFVDPAVNVRMTNDTKVQNDWYLKLDGKIDLVGKSQLVQTQFSELAASSIGSIERDQQGHTNKFNYNYWSSPVSAMNGTSVNSGFTVDGVMRDGTDPDNPQALQWTGSINSVATNPITLSSYWIYKFQNVNNSYANWGSVGQTGTLLAGQGFTMKGSNALTPTQNLTFVGKPNNGTITLPIAGNNLNLSGNPYASAIDADKFIDDNVTSTTGTLFFWEHYNTNTSHNTIQYQGGYATYTKVGGTPPVAPAGISGAGSSSKTPKRFIPVAQGFFVTGSATGGTITFNNSQRLFVKEDNATSSFTMFKANSAPQATVNVTNNEEDTYTQEDFMKIRLGYYSADNYHRQILLGFMNQYATDGIDVGYDGASIESLGNDMYFVNGAANLNIQGEGYFNENNTYPLTVKNTIEGTVSFKVDGKDNFDPNQEIYIHDNTNNTYNSINGQNFEINLPAGITANRFSLRFTGGTPSLGSNDNVMNYGIIVANSLAANTINIKNQLLEATVKTVQLYNILGQEINSWNVENLDQANIVLSTLGIKTGTYIVKVITDKGNLTKKILVK